MPSFACLILDRWVSATLSLLVCVLKNAAGLYFISEENIVVEGVINLWSFIDRSF